LTAAVVSLSDHRVSARIAHDTAKRDGAEHTAPDCRTLAIEHAIDAIARETHGLDLGQRIAVEAALWRMLDDANRRDGSFW
jgi:hypothetical protein